MSTFSSACVNRDSNELTPINERLSLLASLIRLIHSWHCSEWRRWWWRQISANIRHLLNNTAVQGADRRYKILLHVAAHVQQERERKVRVDLLLHHGDHVERVPHCVEAQYLRQLSEAGPLLGADLTWTLGARVHVVALQCVLDGDLIQRVVQIFAGHLASHRVKLLESTAHVWTVQRYDQVGDDAA